MFKSLRVSLAAAVVATPLVLQAAGTQIYKTSFEASGDDSGHSFSTGTLDGQDSWSVDSGTATVTTTPTSDGIADGLQYVNQGENSSISRSVSNSGSGTDRVLMVAHYFGTGSATLETPAASPPMAVVLGFQQASGGIQLGGWDGGDGSYSFGSTINSEEWHRIIVSIDYSSKTYDVAVNGDPYLQDVGFHDSSVSGLTGFQSSSENSASIDGVEFYTSDGDFDDDGVPDDVEITTPGSDPVDPTVGGIMFGDLSGDGMVTPMDVQEAFDCFFTGVCEAEAAADIFPDTAGDGCIGAGDGNGSVTPGDVQRIFNLFMGVESLCS